MANLRDIKRRIVSVQSTQKITSAMKMVAAAKLRRAQEAIENARPYATRMRSTLEEVSKGSLDEGHPLLDVHDDRKSLELIVITSDRGLAGAFNSAVLKEADALLAEREGEFETVGLTLLGKKAGEYFSRIVSWYTKGGFVDELGVRHVSNHSYSWKYWEVLVPRRLH